MRPAKGVLGVRAKGKLRRREACLDQNGPGEKLGRLVGCRKEKKREGKRDMGWPKQGRKKEKPSNIKNKQFNLNLNFRNLNSN